MPSAGARSAAKAIDASGDRLSLGHAAEVEVDDDAPAPAALVLEGAPADDFDRTARPIDGDGDGVAVVDIGMFEAPLATTATIRDDRTGNRLTFDIATGAYTYQSCRTGVTLQGGGIVRVIGCTVQLVTRGAVQINATENRCSHQGSGRVVALPQGVNDRLVDSNTLGNPVGCG